MLFLIIPPDAAVYLRSRPTAPNYPVPIVAKVINPMNTSWRREGVWCAGVSGFECNRCEVSIILGFSDRTGKPEWLAPWARYVEQSVTHCMGPLVSQLEAATGQ